MAAWESEASSSPTGDARGGGLDGRGNEREREREVVVVLSRQDVLVKGLIGEAIAPRW